MRRSVLWTLLGMSFCLVAVGCTADSGSASGDVVPSAGAAATRRPRRARLTPLSLAPRPPRLRSAASARRTCPIRVRLIRPTHGSANSARRTKRLMNLVAVSACQSVSCLVTSGECVVSPLPDGSDCDAGDPCVTGVRAGGLHRTSGQL